MTTDHDKTVASKSQQEKLRDGLRIDMAIASVDKSLDKLRKRKQKLLRHGFMADACEIKLLHLVDSSVHALMNIKRILQ